MKISDIVLHLAQNVPYYSDKFAENITYDSVIASNGTVTVTTSSPHGLTSGHNIVVSHMAIKHDVTSLTQADGIATCILASDHDLTENWQLYVEIEGANESEYNGQFILRTSPNRRKFTFDIDEGAASTATGTIKFVEYREFGFDGSYEINVTSPTTFTFEIADSSLNLQAYNGSLIYGQRVMGSIDIDRFLAVYTKQSSDKYWLVVTLDDAYTSKNREVNSDALSYNNAGVDVRQILIEPFSVFVVGPTTKFLTATEVIDVFVSEVRNALLKTLVGYKFPSDLSESGSSGVVFVSHGIVGYDRATVIHQFRFETYKEITSEDTCYSIDGYKEPTRAFRDMRLNRQNSFLETVMTTDINMDDEPIT